jgi:hypothetical protein
MIVYQKVVLHTIFRVNLFISHLSALVGTPLKLLQVIQAYDQDSPIWLLGRIDTLVGQVDTS